MVCKEFDLFLQPSNAVQVRRIVPLPVQLVAPNASTKLKIGRASCRERALAEPVLLVIGNTVHSRVMFAGQTTTGGTESLKLMVCKQLELLPQPSNAVQVRKMVPLPVQLVVPNASTKLRFVTPLQVSVALAEPV